MSTHNITIQSGTSKRLKTGGKYCDRDIIVTATGGGGGDVPNPEANLDTCTLIFNMDDYGIVAVSCILIEPLGIQAFYRQLAENTTTRIENVVCGSTLLLEDMSGDGLFFSEHESYTQTGEFSCVAGGEGIAIQVPTLPGEYPITFDRS